MSTVLKSTYTPPFRPYSKEELIDLRNTFFNELNIGNMYVTHNKCGHFYMVKRNGKKERIIEKSGKSLDIGNCSVCWRYKSMSDPELKDVAQNLIEAYCSNFYDDNYIYSYRLYDIEKSFYTWLYLEKK